MGKYSIEEMKKIREETFKKWKDSGLLAGLKPGFEKSNIAELYECCKSHKLSEEK